MSLLSRIFVTMGLKDRRKDARASIRSLDVLDSHNQTLRIKDLSATGMFIETTERRPLGSEVRVTLKQSHLLGWGKSPQAELRARVVRWAEDGIGLTFVRDEAHATDWMRWVDMAQNLTASSGVIGLFRLVRALEFLDRVSPGVESRVVALMERLANDRRAEILVETVLRAVRRLEGLDSAIRNDVSADLILLILSYTAKVESTTAVSFWTGLLASSCLAGTGDRESLKMADILSGLLPMHLAIWSAGCERTLKAGGPVRCSVDEIRAIAGIHDLVAIAHHLHYLHDRGLLEKTLRPRGCEQIEEPNLTPSPFGMAFYRRCQDIETRTPAISLPIAV